MVIETERLYLRRMDRNDFHSLCKIQLKHTYLKTNSKQFFEWNIHEKDFLRQITFKTYERSIFKN